jgi:hypothetical protein
LENESMKKSFQRWRKGAVLALGLSVSLTACSDLMDVNLPAQLTDDVLTSPGNASILVNTFIAQFETGWNSQVYYDFGREGSGEVHLCGPCGYSDYQTNSPSFDRLSKSLRFSRYMWDKLNKDWDVKAVPQRARYMALSSLYQGAALGLLGEHLCEVSIDGGPKLTANATLDQAVTMLNRALTEINATGDFAVQNNIASSAKTMANGLLAQVLYQKGDMAGAAAAAALVPNGFYAYGTREPGEDRRNIAWTEGTNQTYMELYDPIDWWKGAIPNPANNAQWPAVLPFTGWTNLGIMPDGRAVSDTGIPVRTAAGPAPWNNAIGVTAGAVADSRVKGHTGNINGKGSAGALADRYTEEGSDEPLVNWKEMILIRAEAAGGQTAIDLVNQIRTADNLPKVTYADPANATQIRYMILEEKRRSLFEEGRLVFTMFRNPDVMWFPRAQGSTRYKGRNLQGGVRWIMTQAEFTVNKNLTVADRATGCGNVEKPVGNLG